MTSLNSALPEKYMKLRGYLGKDNRFERLPGKRQKKLQQLMLEFLAEKFEGSLKYTESEINDILNQYHSFADPATLRRFMIGHQLLCRTNDGRQYWKNN